MEKQITLAEIKSRKEANDAASAKVAKAEKIWAKEMSAQLNGGNKARTISEIFASL